MKEDDPARGHIISTMIFVTAIVTFIQVTFGCRYVYVNMFLQLAVIPDPAKVRLTIIKLFNVF